MKYLSVAVLTLLVFASVGKGADEPWTKLSKLLLREGGNAVGKGVITNSGGVEVLEEGDKFTINAAFKPANTSNAIIGTFRLTVAGKPDVGLTCHEIFGIDAATKTINVVAYWSSGVVEKIAFDRCEGDTFFGKYSIHIPSGDTVSSDCAFVFKEDGTADFNFTSGPNKGETLSSWQWLEETNGEKAFKSYGEFMVGGVWKATVKEREKVDEEWKLTGKTNQLVHEYRWIGEDNRCIKLSGTKDGEKGDWFTILGVDPKRNEFTWWNFSNKGPRYHTMRLAKDGVWISEGRFANADGETITWKWKVTKIGDDEILLEPAGITRNGIKQDATERREGSTWTRHEE